LFFSSRLEKEDGEWKKLHEQAEERSRVVLDFGIPYRSAQPPAFLLPKDRDLLKSSLGDGHVGFSSFDFTKERNDIVLGIDQLNHILSAVDRTVEVCSFSRLFWLVVQITPGVHSMQAVSEGCETTVRKLNVVSFEGYPNQKHPELLVESMKEGSE